MNGNIPTTPQGVDEAEWAWIHAQPGENTLNLALSEPHRFLDPEKKRRVQANLF